MTYQRRSICAMNWSTRGSIRSNSSRASAQAACSLISIGLTGPLVIRRAGGKVAASPSNRRKSRSTFDFFLRLRLQVDRYCHNAIIAAHRISLAENPRSSSERGNITHTPGTGKGRRGGHGFVNTAQVDRAGGFSRTDVRRMSERLARQAFVYRAVQEKFSTLTIARVTA